ncbi:CDP-alcohol phosphatidyltransferase family protein [Photorhabdus khanii]|uniref:CDP-alcohol phosphatidyltransferase family protein n=1 Tax=Photorhabdus khanii subsp. guanajuatensis TaxID=2100166 RepID=A0A4R4JS28_9GAMM|nr:CDP-alcohol phosphatidyltransferase family protein [Photorhabdus khanii]TDB56872.1 hypothetical protein C5467_12725 [Photorhabdus khanii subsp. guanajuatensis]
MTLYDIKPKFQNLLRPWVIRLYQRGVTANQVTLCAMITSVIVGGILAFFPYPHLFLLLPFFLFFRMALNAIDGMLAREFNQQSRLGAVLNEIGDIVSDFALYLPFALLANTSLWLVIFTVIFAISTEFCGVVAQTLTGVRSYKGPLGKSDRAFLLGIYGVCIALWPQSLVYSNYIFIAAILLLFWTCINRCRDAITRPKQEE